jgi:fused signal recognition particle receptor
MAKSPKNERDIAPFPPHLRHDRQLCNNPAMTENNNWISRLKAGLRRSSSKLTEGLSSIMTKKKLDDETLEELEEALISADLGPKFASNIVASFGKTRFGKEVSADEVRESLSEEIAKTLAPCAQPLLIDRAKKPFVVLMVGVNGSGKTTTIGKLAQNFIADGLRVVLAAGDTFRAAAIGQLQVWGERAGCKIVSDKEGSDAAAVAYRALEQARAEGADVLLVDTAGRLQNKSDLMQELAKIVRVLKKIDNDAPHATILVLDATTGQNAHAQVEVFQKMTNLTGLIVTKLDGTAKGGVLVALADRFKLPIHAIGVGEKAEDLRPFDAKDFATALLEP